MRVRVPIPNTGGGKKQLSNEQWNLLVILEDATLRFVRDEVGFLLNLREVKGDGLAKVSLYECLGFIDRRVRQIRRGWPHEKAEDYEQTLLEVVDTCDDQRHRLRVEIRTALAQKIQYQHIQRVEYIAVAAGLVDSAARIHEWLTGKVQYYDPMREKLEYVDGRIGCWLLNEGKLPDMEEAQKQFGVLFDTLCTAVLETFTEPKEKAVS